MTYKPQFTITHEIAHFLLHIERHKEGFTHLMVTPSFLASLRESARLMSTHYSTQIEGNRLSMEEVALVVKENKGRFAGRERDEKEVKNYFLALEFVENAAREKESLTEKLIQVFHGLSFHGKNKPTPYRPGQNVIRDRNSGAIIYMPPEAHDVPTLMRELVDWINERITSEKPNLPIPLIAAIAHYQFATIHPYYDGNGRTARLLTTYILHLCGYGLNGIFSLEEYYAKNLGGYYEALTVGPSHNYYGGRAEADITGFLHYFCEGMAEAFEKVHRRAQVFQGENGVDFSKLLRELSPQQRSTFDLFKKQKEVSSNELASHLGISSRSASELAIKWVDAGFLIISNPSKRARKYGLIDVWEDYLLSN